MTSPADMPRIQWGVTCRHGQVHLFDTDDDPHWGTAQQAMWTINALRALHPDTDYFMTSRRKPMDCPECGRLLVLDEHGPTCRHCEENTNDQ